MGRRPPILRAYSSDLVVDNFAGGGGASVGIEQAIGRPVDMAINHSPEAIAMHRANHPETRHFCEDIWQVDPREACAGRPVGLAWFSPDCTHHSRARGGVPRSQNIRGLAWVVIRWAASVRPSVIVVENVEEFRSWGPLDDQGYPVPERAGETYRTWLAQLSALGYQVDVRTLVAADYGTPTIRRRLFMVARLDGQSAWPTPTHGHGRAAPWRPAAEIIDWQLPCPSIFERARPLAPATMRRIAEGMRRYVFECADPFVIPLTHQGGRRGRSVSEPLATVTGAHRGELALVAPTLITRGFGERPGQAPRVPGLDKPLGTVVAQGVKHALVGAWLAKHYGGVVGQPLERPVGTVTSRDHHSLVQAFLVSYYSSGQSNHQDARDPLRTVTSRARFGLVTIHGQPYQVVDIGMRMLQPHELFAAQGFPEDYRIAPEYRGRPLSKTAQISLCGNAVCPPVARAIVAEQLRAP